MKNVIDVQVDLGKTEEDGNDIYGTDENITESMVEKIIKRVMSEPTFRRGKLDTQIEISDVFHERKMSDFLVDKKLVEGGIVVTLGLFDEIGKEPDGDDDVWGESPEFIYMLSEFHD